MNHVSCVCAKGVGADAAAEQGGLHRALSSRHISFIGFGGGIGVGGWVRGPQSLTSRSVRRYWPVPCHGRAAWYLAVVRHHRNVGVVCRKS